MAVLTILFSQIVGFFLLYLVLFVFTISYPPISFYSPFIFNEIFFFCQKKKKEDFIAMFVQILWVDITQHLFHTEIVVLASQLIYYATLYHSSFSLFLVSRFPGPLLPPMYLLSFFIFLRI